MRIVLDTNVLISALLTEGGASRAVLRACLTGELRPLIGNALFAEYEDVMARDALFKNSATTRAERDVILDALLSRCDWIQISYLWRPNLRDEADNHVAELAIAGNAPIVITGNHKDFASAQLKMPFEVLTPGEFLKRGD
jgi:putative PIN family toxin of toxin-antitoxin system